MQIPPAARPTDNVKGVLWALAAGATLTAMFGVLKLSAESLPVLVVAFFRTFTSFLILAPLLLRQGRGAIATKRIGAHFWRAFCGITAFGLTVYALAHLILADAMVITFSAPFWSILIAALFMGEVVRARRIGATLVGFAGVVVIIRPHGGIEPAMLAAVGAAIFTALALTTVKRLTRTEPPARIVFYFFLFGSLILLPGAILTWQTPSAVELAWLIASGVLGAAGQTFLTRAYESGDVSVVAPLDFVRVPFSALLGYLAFAEIPDLWTGIGTLIILGAFLHLAQRERALARAKPSA